MSEPLVIVGNGMAAARLVDDLAKVALGRYAIAVIGDEPRLAYNRVLLSSVLAGETASHDIELRPAAWWTSPKTGAKYPVRWKIVVPSIQLDLDCAAAFDAQELPGEDDTSPAYWEGAVAYTGTRRGVGYLELTGYAKPMRL